MRVNRCNSNQVVLIQSSFSLYGIPLVAVGQSIHQGSGYPIRMIRMYGFQRMPANSRVQHRTIEAVGGTTVCPHCTRFNCRIAPNRRFRFLLHVAELGQQYGALGHCMNALMCINHQFGGRTTSFVGSSSSRCRGSTGTGTTLGGVENASITPLEW